MPPLILAKRKIAKRRDTGLWPSWTARAAHDRSEGDLWIPPPPTPRPWPVPVARIKFKMRFSFL